MKATRQNYCQYLLVSQINNTLTNFADHTEAMSHDAINRCLNKEQVTASTVWQTVRDNIVLSKNGYVVFDDTVVDNRQFLMIRIVRVSVGIIGFSVRSPTRVTNSNGGV